MSTAAPILNSTLDVKPWYKHRWPWFLMLGPFLVVVAGSFTIWIAMTQQDALVVDDYYKQGKAINQDLRRDRVAADFGVHFVARYDTPARMLRGSVSNTARQTIGKINIRLIHSTLPEKDVTLTAAPDAAGNFAVALPMLDMARWQVLVENEERDWRLNGVWSWPAQQGLEIYADAVTKN